MEELLRPGVSSARDVPSPELRLHARARTGPAAWSSLGGVVVPMLGSRSGLVRGSLGLAQLVYRCRKLKRQEKEGQVEKTTEEERKGGRETNAPGCCTRPTRTACAGTDTSRPGLPAFSGCQRMENDLRGGDWASPPDLNLSDKTRAFRKKKSHTTGAMSPSFRRRGVVASIWKLQTLEAAAALPANARKPQSPQGTGVAGAVRGPARPPGDAPQSAVSARRPERVFSSWKRLVLPTVRPPTITLARG